MNHNLKYGLILAASQIGVILIVLIVDPNQLDNSSSSIISTIIYFGILLLAGIKLRNEHEGILNFKKVFISTFLIIIIGGLFVSVFNILLYNVVIPEVAETMNDRFINIIASQYEQSGFDDEMVDQSVEIMSYMSPYKTSGILLNYIGSLIGGVIISLIVAWIVHRKEPEFR